MNLKGMMGMKRNDGTAEKPGTLSRDEKLSMLDKKLGSFSRLRFEERETELQLERLRQIRAPGTGSPQRIKGEQAELRRVYGERLSAARRAMRDLLRIIEAVPDYTLRRLLRLRYVEGLRWREVAEELELEERQIYRLRKKALGLALDSAGGGIGERGGRDCAS